MSYPYPSAPSPYPQNNAAYPPNNAAYPPVNNASYLPPAAYPPTNNNPYPQGSAYPPTPAYDSSSNKYTKQDTGIPTMPPGYDPNNPIQTTHNDNHRFEPPNGPQDLWAALLFLAQMIGFSALAATSIPKIDFSTFSLKGSEQRPGSSPALKIDFKPYAIEAIAVSAIVAFALSVLYLFAMRKFPKQLIKFTFWFSTAMCFVMAALSFVTGSIVSGVLMLIVGAMYIFFYRFYKSRMPFAAVMLETVADVTMKYPGTVTAGIIGLVVQLVYFALWAVTAIASTIVYGQPQTRQVGNRTQTSMNPTAYVLFVYLIFSSYWCSQVIKNTVHVTVSGVFASFFFLSGSPQGMPNSPTSGSFKRIITVSFGSIAYGSLLIALIQTLRTVIRSIANNNNDSMVGMFIACCIDCILSWIESMAEIFNFYALTQVAIYGKDFCRAAKDTIRLIKDRGIDALINDSLIDNVLGFGGFLVGLIALFVGWVVYAIGAATRESTGTGISGALVFVLVVTFLAGIVMFGLISGVISSGVASTFVCLAEDPAALRATKPDLFQKIIQTYPDAQISMYH